MILPLSYHFEPGAQNDGVSVRIPAAALNQLSSTAFDYLVPGMLEEKVIEFIRNLPKQVRKQFVPVPEYAKACIESIDPEIPIIESISKALKRMTGHAIDEDLLRKHLFSDHMQMRYEVVDEAGKIIATGRDLNALKQTVGFKHQANKSKAKQANNSLERHSIQQWDFDTLPETVLTNIAGMKIKAWPALVDKGDSVSIKLFDSPQQAQKQTGLLRLILLQYPKKKNELARAIPEIQKLCLYYTSTGKCEELKKSIIKNTFRFNFIQDELENQLHGVQLQKETFLKSLKEKQAQLENTLNELSQQLITVLSLTHKIRKQLKGNIDLTLLETYNDINDQLQMLVYPGFLDDLSLEELRHYPRYLKAILKRLEKLKGNAHKDRGLQVQIQPLWEEYKKTLKKYSGNAALKEYRWMLEEFRVSLFAQDLGTSYPVSAKRLSKRFAEIKKQIKV